MLRVIKEGWQSQVGTQVVFGLIILVTISAMIRTLFFATDIEPAKLPGSAWLMACYLIAFHGFFIWYMRGDLLAEVWLKLVGITFVSSIFILVARADIYGSEIKLIVSGDCYTYRVGRQIKHCYPSEDAARKAMNERAAHRRKYEAMQSRKWEDLPD